MKACASCGTSFAPAGPNHRFCSRDRRPSRGDEYADGRRTCVACGTLFTRTRPAQRYCSPGCRVSNQAGYPQRKYVARVGRPLKPRGPKPDIPKRAKVKARRESGMTLKEVAAELGVTEAAVSSMLTRMKQEESVTEGECAARPPDAPG